MKILEFKKQQLEKKKKKNVLDGLKKRVEVTEEQT